MSEHSESPSREKRRLNEDTISALPRKQERKSSFHVTMTGGILHQGSGATVVTEQSSDNEESFADDESRRNMDMSRQGKDRHGRVQKVWTQMDEEDAQMMQPDESNKSPQNTATESTNSSVEECGEVLSDTQKFPKEDKICGVVRQKFLCLLAVFLFVVLLSTSIPAAVIATREAIATAPPSQSMAPSLTPSVSLVPSDLPSMVPTDTYKPSDLPSNVPSRTPSTSPTDTYKPSDAPSTNPSLSLVPSVVPTLSLVPSATPSFVPTDTQSPSKAPTRLPSSMPSLSMEPTFTPIDPKWRFKLRLYWEPSYFWQEETEERFWCLECVPCAEYGRDDGWKHGCEAYPNGLNSNCKEGDSVWIRDCRSYGNEYNVLQKHKAGYTLRLHNTNLCIERNNVHLMMKKCNINDPDQQFVAWSDFSKFELRPLVMAGWTEREADCVSQLHHPKSDEVVGMHNCRLCRHYETRYWEIYK